MNMSYPSTPPTTTTATTLPAPLEKYFQVNDTAVATPAIVMDSDELTTNSMAEAVINMIIKHGTIRCDEVRHEIRKMARHEIRKMARHEIYNFLLALLSELRLLIDQAQQQEQQI
jgi:hypothetical protein